MNVDQVVERLEELADPDPTVNLERFGVTAKKSYGIRTPVLRKLAKEIGKNHDLALDLWDTGIHDARAIACFIDRPRWVTEDQMEHWASGFESWADTDCACYSLFDATPFAWDKAYEWSSRDEEFVKRGAFAIVAAIAVHDKKADDAKFMDFLPVIERESDDDRNFVKKGVNWALRQIGKRNLFLNEQAIETGKTILARGTRAARWTASDALRELRSEKVQERLRR